MMHLCISRVQRVNELSHIVKKHPVELKETQKPLHQQLYFVFEKPLLVDCEIRHQFEEGQTLMWYKEKIVNYRNQQFQMICH